MHDSTAPNTTFTLAWKDANGTLVARQDITADGYGYWHFCSATHRLSAGDTLKATNAAGTNALDVPLLTIAVNRVHNYVSGRAPAGSVVHIHCDGSNGFEPCIWTRRTRAGVNGYWSQPIGWDVQGGEPYHVSWKTADGDRVSAYGQAAFVYAEIGTANVTGAIEANTLREIDLYDASMNLKGTATAIGSPRDGGFSAVFRDAHDQRVDVEPADTIDASAVASDAHFVAPQIEATATASTDRVTGQCQDTGTSLGYADISLYRTGNLVGFAQQGEDGVFDFNFRHLDAGNEANVKVGDRLVVNCVQDDNDGALLTIYAQ